MIAYGEWKEPKANMKFKFTIHTYHIHKHMHQHKLIFIYTRTTHNFMFAKSHCLISTRLPRSGNKYHLIQLSNMGCNNNNTNNRNHTEKDRASKQLWRQRQWSVANAYCYLLPRAQCTAWATTTITIKHNNACSTVFGLSHVSLSLPSATLASAAKQSQRNPQTINIKMHSGAHDYVARFFIRIC